jgi:hypothetical protein
VVVIEIDYDKYNYYLVWDGLKGQVTNTKLTDIEVIEKLQKPLAY